MKLLEGKTACITGGTSGIGLGIAQTFIEHGCQVILVGTNSEKGQKAVESLGQAARFFSVDVSDSAEVEKFAQETSQVDILVNCAGITKDGLLMRMSEEDWDRVLDVNLKSCFLMSKAFVRQMMKNKSGKIINISSVIGLTGNPGQVNYSASKFGMIGFTRSLAKEVGTKGICVNAIAPGFIHTEMTQKLNETQKESILSRVPMKRFGDAKDIANAALYLGSSLSDYVTGTTLVVDGGMLA